MNAAAVRHSERLRRLNAAREAVDAAVRERGLGKGRAGTGLIVCPNCDGYLYYVVSGADGRTVGRCSTKGCAEWFV